MPADASAVPTSAARRRGRPPKPVAQREAVREHLIRAGIAVLTEKGYSAVGLDEILRAVGVPKGSFYAYFPGKDAFGLAMIDAYGEYFARKLDRWFLDEQVSPIARIEHFIADAVSGMARFDYARGCLVGNLGQEMGALPESFRARLVDVFGDWQRRTRRCLEAARAAGELPPQADCGFLAEYFWIGWEGAVLRAKLERSAAPLQTFARGFLAAARAGRG
ncbi:MAG: TetR/AcrR family transcriptional regulator [Burkholderiaceae bacterium]